MKPLLRLIAICAVALLISGPAAFAQAPAVESSTLPVNEPLDVGGTILQPGAYVIRVVSPVADRNKVQITNADGSVVYATLLTVPHALAPGEDYPNTTFVFYPAGEGQPRALRTWFPVDPPSGGGHDIVYEESRAKQLARLAKGNVVAYRGEPTTELEIVTPEATVETYVAPAPVTPSAPMTSAAETDESPAEMPETAGSVPLIALFGMLLLGAAALVRLARRHA